MIRINGGQATLGANTFTGAQVAPTLAIGGATIGTDALAVTGTASISGLIISGGLSSTLDIQTASTRVIGWGSRSFMSSPADSIILLRDNGLTAFDRLQFGGTTSSFPAIKRNSTGLSIRLADDSADASLSVSSLTVSSTGFFTSGGTFLFRNSAQTAGGIINVNTNSTFKFYAMDGTTRAIMEGDTRALVGATIGSNELAVTGTSQFTGLMSVTGSFSASDSIQAGNGDPLGWTSAAQMYSATDGVIRLSNNASTDFTRLQFGGTTSSFPAIQRSGAGLQVRLADGSNYADILAANVTATNIMVAGGYCYTSISTSVSQSAGAGSPEGVVTRGVGATWCRTDGGAGTTFYVKESGTGNTGWVGK